MKKNNKAFIFSLIFSLVNLIIPIAYTIKCKINSYIVSDILIAIPVVAFILSLLFVVIKKLPNAVKLILSITILCFSVFLSFWFNAVGGYIEFRTFVGSKEVNSYNAAVEENQNYFDKMVKIDKYGDFEDIATYKYLSTGIFPHLAFTTIVKYDKENFEKTVINIEESYDFYSEPVIEGDDEPVFTFEGFYFRVDKSESRYPKVLHLIGINNETCEVAYVDFEFYDLDCISDFSDDLYTFCGWRYIIEERNG